MHPENKLTNHGKTGNGGAQSQHQNVNQGPACNLGSKGVGAGSHGAKANQISPSNSSLKNPQAGVSPFSSLKGKVKRERSVSVDSGEQREAGTPSLESEAKGTVFLTSRLHLQPETRTGQRPSFTSSQPVVPPTSIVYSNFLSPLPIRPPVHSRVGLVRVPLREGPARQQSNSTSVAPTLKREVSGCQPITPKSPDVLAGGSLLGTGTGAWKSHSGSSLPPPKP